MPDSAAVATERSADRTPPGRHTLKLLVAPIIVLIVVSNIGDALAPKLVEDNPLLLIAMNARNRNLILVTNQLDALSYYLVGTLRLLLSDPLFFLIGYWYGDTALTWMEQRTKTYGSMLRQWERGFGKAAYPLVFIAPATTNQSLKELIEAARAKPDSVSYGSIGSGSPQHLAAELLSSMAKARFLHIPYKGSGPLVQDAVGGHVDMAVSSVPPAVPLVRAGKLRALAVMSSARSEALPDVPTMAELGFAGYEFNTWVGVAVPKGTPKDAVDRLRDGMGAALGASEVQATLRDQGAVPAGTTAEQFRQFVHDEVAKSDRIVSQAGIQPE